MTPTPNPPPSLPRDEAQGIYVVLALPWGEPAADSHPTDPGRVYTFGDVHQPKNPDRCAVNFDHEADDTAGAILATAADRAGLWCSVKLGRRGQAWLARGKTAVSAEIDDRGYLEGLALIDAPLSEPGFTSARVLVEPGHLPTVTADDAAKGELLTTLLRKSADSGGRVVLNGQKPPPLPTPARVAVDAGEHKRRIAEFSPDTIAADVEYRRQRFEQDRLARQRHADELEVQNLMAAGVPMSQWPPHTEGRQMWDRLQARRAAERAEALAAAAQQATHYTDHTDPAEPVEPVEPVEQKEHTSWMSRVRARIFPRSTTTHEPRQPRPVG